MTTPHNKCCDILTPDKEHNSKGNALPGNARPVQARQKNPNGNLFTEIKVSVRCNNNCVFCLNTRRDWQKSFEQIKDEILSAKSSGVTTVSFTGGEIAIHPDLFNILDFTQNQGLKIHIHTNGRAFSYASFTERVCKYGIEAFLVSLHAHTPELYKKLCGTDGYSQTVKGIYNLISAGQLVNVNCVFNNLNIIHAPEIAKHHTSLGISKIQFGWVSPKGRAASNFDEIVPRYSDKLYHLTEALDWLDENFSGTVYTLGIPYCILKKHSYFKAKEYSDQIILTEGKPRDIRSDPSIQQKCKLKTCTDCIYEPHCEGIFTEYIARYGCEEFTPAKKTFLRILCIAGYFPQPNSDEMPNYGAYRVTNDLLLKIQESTKPDKIIYFLNDEDLWKYRNSGNARIKIKHANMISHFSDLHEQEIIAAYCVSRRYMMHLDGFSFKKIGLIHSQDGPDLLKEYQQYIFFSSKKNCIWVSPSEAGRKIALRIFREFEKHKGMPHAHRIEVIPWGVNSINDQPPEYDGKAVRFLYLGRINSSYKLDLQALITTFKRLAQEHPKAELHLAGKIEPEDRDYLNQNWHDRITYHGEIPEREKQIFIHSHHILVSPVNSIQETFGATLIEAAAQGLMCIGSDWNGHNEILKEENLIRVKTSIPDVSIIPGPFDFKTFCDERKEISDHIKVDEEDLYSKMKKAMDNVIRRQHSQSLRQDIKRYLWDNIVKEHETLWESPDRTDQDERKGETNTPLPITRIPASVFFNTGPKSGSAYRLPATIQIELTNACKMNCIMCPHSKMTRPVGYMEETLFKMIIDEVADHDSRNHTRSVVCLHNLGESLLHPKFTDFLEYARIKNIKAGLSINPQELDDRKIQAICNGVIDILDVSIDGLSDDEFKRIRGDNADLILAESNLKKLVQYKQSIGASNPVIRVQMIHMKGTEDNAQEFRKRWIAAGADTVRIKKFSSWNCKDLEIKTSDPDQEFARPSHPCIYPLDSMVILWDGKVVPCCYDYDGEKVLGDAKTESLGEIWSSSKATDFRERHTKDDLSDESLCSSCRKR